MEAEVEVLRRSKLFRHLDEAELQAVVSGCRLLALDPEQVLFEYGAPAASMYLVLEGEVRVARNDRVLNIMRAGEHLGELALIDEGLRSASAIANSPARLLEISQPIFERYILPSREALAAMMQTATRLLRQLTDVTQAAYEELNMLVHDMLSLLCVHEYAALVMERLPPDDEGRLFLERILRTRDALESFMRGALKRARGTAGPYRREPVQLEPLLRECLEHDLLLHEDVRRVQLTLTVEGPLPAVPCNPLDIKRAVANLVINAAQAMPGGGSIAVRLRRGHDHVAIEVSDSGPGIPEEIRARVFETHFTTKEHGSGLGLASCRDIIERLHHGRLTLETEPGVGTTFTCELPAG